MLKPAWYEKKLWHLYDCTDSALNLYQCPTIAYSGELDTQKQAADVMAEALTAEGLELKHIIGPRTRDTASIPSRKRTIEAGMASLVQSTPVERTFSLPGALYDVHAALQPHALANDRRARRAPRKRRR